MEWLTTTEVAEMLKLKPQTLRVWRWKRKGPPYRSLGRSVRYLRSEVDAWAAEQDGPETAPEAQD